MNWHKIAQEVKEYDLDCPECGSKLQLHKWDNRLYYRCKNYPNCKVTHGAFKDGRPQGVPGDLETIALRKAAHMKFKELFKTENDPKEAQQRYYNWLSGKLNVPRNLCHMALFDKETLRRVIGICNYLIEQKKKRQKELKYQPELNLSSNNNWYKTAQESSINAKTTETTQLTLFPQEKDKNDVSEWAYEQYNGAVESVVNNFKNNPRKKQGWTIIPFARLKKIWEDFSRMGIVRDERGLNDIAEIVVKNIFRLQVNTELAGHTQLSPEEVIESTDVKWTKRLDSLFGDHILDKKGQWRISDYAMKDLINDAFAIKRAKTPTEKLLAVDKALNRIHQRGDIAVLFIEGGSQALSQLSGMTNMSCCLSNWYKTSQEQYFYVTNCSIAEGKDIERMIDNSVDIKWKEFNKYVSNKEIRNALGNYNKGYDYDDFKTGSGLKFQDDYTVSFHKSNYRGQPCYYFDWSAIEFVFVRN